MLTIRHSTTHGVDFISLVGRLGSADITKATDEIQQILEGGSTLITFDMKDLEFIDSSGLSVLVSTLKKTRRSGGNVVLANVNDRILALLELTRLHEIFDIYDNEQVVLARFG